MISGVETIGLQGVKSKEYLDISIFYTGSRTGCSSVQNGKFFLSELFGAAPNRLHRVTIKEEFEIDVANPSHF